MSQHRPVQTGRTLLALAQREQLPFLAAAIAYYAFVSLVPLLVVALAAGTAVAGETVTVRVLTAAGAVLTPEATDLVAATLDGSQTGVTLVGLTFFTWSGLRVFRGLDTAFARIYGTGGRGGIRSQLTDATATAGTILLAVLATAVAAALVPMELTAAARVAGPAGLAVVLSVAFFPLYYVLPDQSLAPNEAAPGAALAGVGWALLGVLFGLYTSQASTFELYGVVGGVFLLLVWLYAGGLLVLLGASLNAVTVRDRQLQHQPLRESRNESMSEADDGDSDGDGVDANTNTNANASNSDSGSSADHNDDDDGDGDQPAADHNAEANANSNTTPDSGPDTDSAIGSADPAADRPPRADAVTQTEIDELRRELDTLEADLDDRTVHRDEIKSELQQYVRRRVRRGRARGWGPYLVLGYGTAMTLGAFAFLSGGWAVLAMLVVWLSTLGLYTVMVVTGLTLSVAGAPGRLLERLR